MYFKVIKLAQNSEWFEIWFNTPYYHILYKDRDESEAEELIRNLIRVLHPKKEDKILDLACGKGRHAIFLNKMGYDVTGVDLSAESIHEAKKSENNSLCFDVHDMREVYKENAYQFVLNLFTSFGYFENFADNARVLNAIYKMLTPDGIFVLDFMNLTHVLKNLVVEEEKNVDGILFHITRKCDGVFLYKDIRFQDKGKEFYFQEKVQAITKLDLEILLEVNNFKILNTFGDFNLSAFNEDKSDRLIFIVQKK